VFFVGHAFKPRWKEPGQVQAIVETLADVVKRHPIDPSRLYLLGEGQGGCALWDFAAQYPGKWAAAVAVSPECFPKETAKVPHLPCWIFQQKSAAKETANPARKLTKALQKRNDEAVLTEYTRETDVWRSPELFAWLAQKKLDKKVEAKEDE
jgi:predicted peptidase